MWASVTDSWPILTQLWFKACARTANMQAPFLCMWPLIVPTGTKRSSGVGTVLAHNLRRWIGVVPALGGRISCFVVMTMGYCLVDTTHRPSVDLMPGRRRIQWTGSGPALNRHWDCFSRLLGDQTTKKYRF